MMTEQEFLQNVTNTSCATSINQASLVRMLVSVFPSMAVSFTDTGMTPDWQRDDLNCDISGRSEGECLHDFRWTRHHGRQRDPDSRPFRRSDCRDQDRKQQLMYYTKINGFVENTAGRRQFADRDLENNIPGTEVSAAAPNPLYNEIVHCIEQAGITLSADDDTQLWPAIEVATTLFATGCFLRRQFFSGRLGKFTLSTATRLVRFTVLGAGSADGEVASTSGNGATAGPAGAAGGEIIAEILASAFNGTAIPYAVSLGSVGVVRANEGDSGAMSIGASTGPYLVCMGAPEASMGGSISPGAFAQSGQRIGGSYTVTNWSAGTVVVSRKGANGPNGFVLSNGSATGTPVSGIDASSRYGAGGSNTNNGNGSSASRPGACGSGAARQNGSAYAGGNGGAGWTMVEEFS